MRKLCLYESDASLLTCCNGNNTLKTVGQAGLTHSNKTCHIMSSCHEVDLSLARTI